mmetsp:Transcript_2053/g.3136  ORF Transcript_2053/g.3136 Transcript_2053/m.3136 type:complete len:221 (+) Transcript_2053:832-1494(+)
MHFLHSNFSSLSFTREPREESICCCRSEPVGGRRPSGRKARSESSLLDDPQSSHSMAYEQRQEKEETHVPRSELSPALDRISSSMSEGRQSSRRPSARGVRDANLSPLSNLIRSHRRACHRLFPVAREETSGRGRGREERTGKVLRRTVRTALTEQVRTWREGGSVGSSMGHHQKLRGAPETSSSVSGGSAWEVGSEGLEADDEGCCATAGKTGCCPWLL